MSRPPRPVLLIALCTTGLLGGLAWLASAAAEPPARPPTKPPTPLSKVISLTDLQDEAAFQLALVKQHLDTSKSYADSAKHELPRAAGLLAVIGQAIAEHDSKPATGKSADRPPIHGPALRDAALKLAAGKSHAQALAAVPALQAAVSGQAARSGVRRRPWTGLISLHHLMEELNSRNSRLRRAVRRSRDPQLDSRNAATMSLLGLVVLADTHEVKQKDGLPTWKQYSKDFQVNAAAVARALRAGDKDRVKPLYLKAAKACADCHSHFRNE